MPNLFAGCTGVDIWSAFLAFLLGDGQAHIEVKVNSPVTAFKFVFSGNISENRLIFSTFLVELLVMCECFSELDIFQIVLLFELFSGTRQNPSPTHNAW